MRRMRVRERAILSCRLSARDERSTSQTHRVREATARLPGCARLAAKPTTPPDVVRCRVCRCAAVYSVAVVSLSPLSTLRALSRVEVGISYYLVAHFTLSLTQLAR